MKREPFDLNDYFRGTEVLTIHLSKKKLAAVRQMAEASRRDVPGMINAALAFSVWMWSRGEGPDETMLADPDGYLRWHENLDEQMRRLPSEPEEAAPQSKPQPVSDVLLYVPEGAKRLTKRSNVIEFYHPRRTGAAKPKGDAA